MTDLTNDATYNLETGAAGGQGVGANGAAPSRAEEFAAKTTREAEARLHAAQSRAEELAASATREAEIRVAQAREWATTQSDAVRTQVLDKPFISVGTAFAAGIVFGLLLRR